ncbi:peptidoglycan-binding protein [Parafrankia sp. FMc2]|uniref:peptidoglycan-binding protein n=1 Tax=Parafrankia sp. FMc2 TaxID=3233196 RepID=UPI0034D7812C
MPVTLSRCPLSAGTAGSSGRYFAGVPTYASSHVGVDPGGVVRYAPDERGCYGAERNSNRRGWHIEHAGYARFAAEWSSPEGLAMIEHAAEAAEAAAYAVRRYGIPVRMLSDREVAAFTPGFAHHAQIARAFKVPGGHTDPGLNYPAGELLARVNAILGRAPRTPLPDPNRADNRFRGFPLLRPGARDDAARVAAARAGTATVLDPAVPVLTLQVALNRSMDAKLGGDGVYGDFTEAAVRQFQSWWRSNGLDLGVDGICGPATWSQLDVVADLQGR